MYKGFVFLEKIEFFFFETGKDDAEGEMRNLVLGFCKVVRMSVGRWIGDGRWDEEGGLWPLDLDKRPEAPVLTEDMVFGSELRALSMLCCGRPARATYVLKLVSTD